MSDGQVVIDVQLGDKSKIQSDAKVINEILKVLGINAGDQMDKNFAKNAKSVDNQAKQTSDKVKSAFKEPVVQKISTKDEATEKARGIVDKIFHMRSFKGVTISAKDSASKTLRGVKESAELTKKSFVGLKGIVAGTLVGMAAGKAFSIAKDGLTDLVHEGINYNKEQQVMNAAWTTLTGNATKGKALVDMVNNLSTATGQSADLTNELAQGFYHLHSSKNEAEDMTKAILNMGDAVGLSGAQIKTVGLDMVHSLSSGKLDLSGLNQMSDYFPMFQEEMAKHYHVTVGTLRKMVTAGKVSAADVETVFKHLGNVKYGKAADNMLSTMTGMERVIKARVPKLMGEFVAPFNKLGGGLFKSISDYTNSGTADKEFKKMGNAAEKGATTIMNAFGKVFGKNSIKDGMKDITDSVTKGITNFSNFIAKHAKGISNFFSMVKKTGSESFTLLIDVVKDAISILSPFTKIIGENPKLFAWIAIAIFGVVKAIKAWELVQAALNVVMDANPISLIIIGVAALAAGIVELIAHWKSVKKGLGEVWGWMKKEWKDTAEQLTTKSSWLNKHTNGAFSDLWNGAKKTFSSGFKTLGDLVKLFADLFTGKWGSIGKDFKKLVSDAWSTVKNYFKTGFNILNDLTGGMLGKIWSKTKSIGGSVVNFFKNLPGNMAKGIKNGAHWVEQAFINLGNGMLSGIGKGVNGVISGIDWVLKKVDAPTIPKWKIPKFATGGKALGLSIVGEAGKNELIRHSDGQVEMSPNTATLYNFTDPVDILGGDATESLLGSMPKMFAQGTWLGSAMDFVKGGWNSIAKGAEGFWNEVTHPAKLLNTAIAKFTNLSGLSPNIAKMAEGTVKTVASDAVNWVKKQLMGSADNPSGSKIDRWKPVIERAAGMSGIKLDGSGMSAIINRIKKESGGDPTVLQKVVDVNSRAGHPAIGLLQYIPSTFAAWARKGYTNIRSGLAQLLAMFNDSHWLKDISMPGGWGPTGAKRYAKGTTSLTNFLPKYASGTSALQSTRFNYSMGRISASTYIADLEKIEKEYKLTAAQHRSVLLSIHTAEKKVASDRESSSKKAESTASKRAASAKKAETDRQKSYANRIANLKTEFNTGKISRQKYIADLESIEKHHKLNSSLIRQIKTDVYEAQKQFTTAQNTLNKDIASAATTYANKVKSINTDLTSKIKSINTDLQNNIKTLQDQYNSDLSSKQSDIYGSIFDSSSSSVTYKQDLISQMKESLHDATAYKSDMASLNNKIPSAMMDELKAAGIGSESQIHAMTTMSSSELKSYISMWQQRHTIANAEAAKELASEKASTNKQIAAAKKSASDQIKAAKAAALKELDAAKTAFITKLNSYKGIRKAGMSFGSNTVKGIIDGLKGQQGALESQLNKIAKTMTKTIKKTLKIHSPSQVMRDEVGANVGAGLAIGIDQSNNNVAAAAKRLAKSAVPEGLMDQISSFVSSAAQMVPAINIPAVAIAGSSSMYPSTAATQQINSKPLQLTVVTQYDGREVARTTQKPIDIANQQRVNIRQFMQGRNN